MSAKFVDRLLSELEAVRDQFGPTASARALRLLRTLGAVDFPDETSLIRLHEAALFLRAFPQSSAVLRATESILSRFRKKVEALRRAGGNMEVFDTFEVSGIAGTTMEDTLSFDVASWLVRRMAGKVEIAWENYEPGRELGTTGPRFMPLLEDDAWVEADTPWRRWLEAAGGIAGKAKAGNGPSTRNRTAAWLAECFQRLPLPDQQRAELYEALRVPLRWELGDSKISRTRNWRPVRRVFYHDTPLINRSQVSLADELARHPPSFTKLPLRESKRIVEMIREVMLVRYRELYGTTLADPRSVVRVGLGAGAASRGVEIYLWNLPPERRLPLRAYVAGFTLKNGVPINYIEAIGLCEWMEVGFNTFYTFRGGEAGWIYAQVLRSLCAWMGTTVVSVYPYQLGHDNDEAIQSGAFWFYRKLGFRPGRDDLRQLTEREEQKIASDPKYRTPARTLKRLASGHVFYELPGSEIGAWDAFATRNIGLRVNERMARDFAGDAVRMREHARQRLERILDVRTVSWTALERQAFANFAFVLSLVSELRRWTSKEKENLLQIILAKPKPKEMPYLHLTQRHGRLREALLKCGSVRVRTADR